MAKKKPYEEITEENVGSVYDQMYFTPEERRQQAEVVNSAMRGETSWDDANRFVEKTRYKYGYQGGKDGSKYTPVNKTPAFTYEKAPEYISQRQMQIDAALNNLMNRDAFSYNPENDPLYGIYKGQYTRNGKMAMDDTIGQMSARTGGLASSFAETAGQQMYNRYMDELSGKIPQLQQIAYQRYMDEENRQRQNLATMMQMEGMDYDRYRDRLSQYNNDRGFAYGNFRDQIGDTRYDDETAYNRGRDAEGDRRYNQEWNYQVGRDKVADDRYNQEWQHALDREAVDDQRYNDKLAYDRQQDAIARQDRLNAQAGKGGSGGAGGKPSGSFKDVQKKAMSMDDPNAAKKYLESMVDDGFITEEEAYTIYKRDLADGNPPKTYEEFVNMTGNPSIMNRREFSRQKASGDTRSYEEYLADMYQKYR